MHFKLKRGQRVESGPCSLSNFRTADTANSKYVWPSQLFVLPRCCTSNAACLCFEVVKKPSASCVMLRKNHKSWFKSRIGVGSRSDTIVQIRFLISDTHQLRLLFALRPEREDKSTGAALFLIHRILDYLQFAFLQNQRPLTCFVYYDPSSRRILVGLNMSRRPQKSQPC